MINNVDAKIINYHSQLISIKIKISSKVYCDEDKNKCIFTVNKMRA